jgi:hypothetical protein
MRSLRAIGNLCSSVKKTFLNFSISAIDIPLTICSRSWTYSLQSRKNSFVNTVRREFLNWIKTRMHTASSELSLFPVNSASL